MTCTKVPKEGGFLAKLPFILIFVSAIVVAR